MPVYVDYATYLMRDGMYQIPLDPLNSDYQAYLSWVAAGNTATKPAQTVAQALASQLALLNSQYSSALAALTSSYPDYEVATWTMQNDEARQWTAADDASKPDTPFLTALWTKRQALGWVEPFADLVGRVISNSNAYTAAVANYTGIRHVAEKNLLAAADPMTITWSFS